MDNCIFCKIIRGEIPCKKVYVDENVLAFDDINPQALVHTLIVPKRHAANILEADAADIAACMAAVSKVACIKEVKSFRLIANTGADAGQTVEHLHFHLLGGENLGEKLV